MAEARAGRYGWRSTRTLPTAFLTRPRARQSGRSRDSRQIDALCQDDDAFCRRLDALFLAVRCVFSRPDDEDDKFVMGTECAWCGLPAVTEVITRPGRKNRKTAPVCEAHARDFEARDMMTIRLEVEQKIGSQQRRRDWLKRRNS